MSIQSFFNHLAEKREARRKYNALAACIRAGDLDGVRRALANGADAGYMPGSHAKIPLALALRKGDARIFDALLQTEKGGIAAYFWHADFRRYNKATDVTRQVYFLPSYLYAAIESGKEDIAILLARHKIIDVRKAGELMKTGIERLSHDSAMYKALPSPLELARQKGMTRVADIIESRLPKPVPEAAPGKAPQAPASKPAPKRRPGFRL